jgi:hypothetical protein
MNKLSKILSGFIMLAALTFSSCTKIIELDLNTSDPQIVVDARLSDDPTEKATVQLSKTVNFSATNTFPPLSSAVVFIKNRTTGEVDTLKETSAGLYKGSKLVGKVGNIYDLTILTDGKTITATSTISRKVNLDSISTLKQSFLGNTQISLIPRYVDPKGMGDNYRFIISVNGKVKKDILTFNDELSDGELNGRPLFSRGDEEDAIKVGDSVTLELQGIDAAGYLYFSTMAEGGGSQNSDSATPTNPVTNLKGAILGYFSAYSTQKKTIVIQ